MDKQVHALVKGKVQGVGFRWTVMDVAEKLHVKGTVKNLVSGAVEIIAQGSVETLNLFLDQIKSNSFPATIDSIELHYSEIQNFYEDFRILFS